ncbi:phosphatidylglycerophosphatase A family protein [Pseudaminobacter sp. NGMCC 1.201702]|uniref:phosphatidylglycerophosphatase A family protein n=1 Tax=Pseudaminobacter sp. NGMCC 1.201702 TaxID=3391825 RepID=UPI0039F11C8C
MATTTAAVAKTTSPTFVAMAATPHQLVAMMFGLGLCRFWPGTLGSIAGLALFGALQLMSPAYRAMAYLLLILIGAWACQKTGEDLNSPDHNAMVIDETLGMSLVLEFVAPGILMGAIAFLLFRLFDVFKPWPVYVADRRWKGGFFVILDDLLAAIYAILVARFVFMPLLA